MQSGLRTVTQHVGSVARAIIPGMGNLWRRSASSASSGEASDAQPGAGLRVEDDVGMRELLRVLAAAENVHDDAFLTDVVTPILDTVKFSDIGLKQPAHMDRVGTMMIMSGARYSLAFFFLPPGQCLPLHDHPGMNVLQKVMFGKLRVVGYDWVEPRADPVLGVKPPAGIARQVYDTTTTAADAPMRVRPCSGGVVHEIFAEGDEVCGFLDVITPPYTFERDCTYFTASDRLTPASFQHAPAEALEGLHTPADTILADPRPAHVLTPRNDFYGVPMTSFRAPNLSWLPTPAR